MSKLPSEFHGPFEFRYYTDENGEKRLDEVVVNGTGEFVFHMEEMDETHYWFGVTAVGWTCHINIAAKNNRSHVRAIAEALEDQE